VANNALYTKGILYGGHHKTEELLTATDRLNEYIMTSLRTMWGCQLKQIENIMGVPAALAVAAKSEKFVRMQHLSNIDGVLFLTKKGKLFADGIAAELFM
jgi:oxygen-independent coproporphyrinogen-3 oxidase